MISNITKDTYKKELRKTYNKRKVFAIITLCLLICYIALIIATFFVSGLVENSPLDIYSQEGEATLFGLHLTLYAWILIGVGIILLIMQIISTVLIRTIIDPRTASAMQKQVIASDREEQMKNKIYSEWQKKHIKDKKSEQKKK